MADEDMITQAASAMVQAANQGQNPSLPYGGVGSNMTTYGQSPLVAPPLPITPQPPAQIVHSAPTGSFATVGERKRADRHALMDNTMNLIKEGSDYIQQKRQRALTMDIYHVMEAQHGMEEAKALLQQNPNDANAKEGLQRNIGILNVILGDSKKLKALQKAFEIDLFGTGGGKNKVENQALSNAAKEWDAFRQKQQGGDKTALNPAVQRLLQAQAWRQQTNPLMSSIQQAVKDKLMPDANTMANIQNDARNRIADAAKEKFKGYVELERARLLGGQLGGAGTIINDPSSSTGLTKVFRSKDGSSFMVQKDVVLPTVLPSVHEGYSDVTIDDPDQPGSKIVVRIPKTSVTQKVSPTGGGPTSPIPGTPMAGSSNVGGAITNNKIVAPKASDGLGVQTKEEKDKTNRLGLPQGSRIIGSKGMSAPQIDKIKEGVNALGSTIDRLSELRGYADIYAGMFSAGKVKIATTPTGYRVLQAFIPTTDDEKKASAVWQESAEYMNVFRKILSAQGFRSIPSYDNMLALRGQLWQSGDIIRKTLDDGIGLLKKDMVAKQKLLGGVDKKLNEAAPTTKVDPSNPDALQF